MAVGERAELVGERAVLGAVLAAGCCGVVWKGGVEGWCRVL